MFQVYFNPTQDGIFFEAAHGWGEGGGREEDQKSSSSSKSVTYILILT